MSVLEVVAGTMDIREAEWGRNVGDVVVSVGVKTGPWIYGKLDEAGVVGILGETYGLLMGRWGD